MFYIILLKGVYKSLPAFESLNFYALLKNDMERKICDDYVFKYEAYLNEIVEKVCNEKSENLKLNLGITKIFKILVDISNLFSKYYSKVHILEVKINSFVILVILKILFYTFDQRILSLFIYMIPCSPEYI